MNEPCTCGRGDAIMSNEIENLRRELADELAATKGADDRRVAERERRSVFETDDSYLYARRINVDDRRISPAIGEHAITECARLRAELASAVTITGRMMAEYAQIRDVNADLISSIKHALVSIRVCAMPMGSNVASNGTILQITFDGLSAAIARATEGKVTG